LTDWVCRHFPLFARDLPQRKVLHFSGSGRLLARLRADDQRRSLGGLRRGRALPRPALQPGERLHRSAQHDDRRRDRADGRPEREAKCRQHETLVRALYEAFVPGFAESYVALGDPEAYSLKYTWELTVYYAFYVFPFINDLFTESRFVPGFLRRFGRLGRINQGLQETIRDFYHWRKAAGDAALRADLLGVHEPRAARRGGEDVLRDRRSGGRAHQVLDVQLANLEELARMIMAWIASRVVDDPAALHDRAFVDAIDLDDAAPSTPTALRGSLGERSRGSAGRKEWRFDPSLLERFRTPLAEASGALRNGRRERTAELAAEAG
jgi:hypothetical protein